MAGLNLQSYIGSEMGPRVFVYLITSQITHVVGWEPYFENQCSSLSFKLPQGNSRRTGSVREDSWITDVLEGQVGRVKEQSSLPFLGCASLL